MTEEVFSTFDVEVKKRHDEMIADLESISIDDLKSEGISLSFGGKTFKFTDLDIIENDNLEDRLRKEFKEKLNTQQQRIRDKINTKINQLLLMHQQKQDELDKKEKNLKKKYSEAAMMPDITESHMSKGLSVFKGSSNNELTWVYKAVYNPRFIALRDSDSGSRGSRKERKVIPTRLANRMKMNMLIFVKTKDNKVIEVSTRKEVKGAREREFPRFPHYHLTSYNDCWGSWKHDSRWSSPDDILKIAKDAEAVLQTINQGSVATREPEGLPKLSTLLSSVKNLDYVKESDIIKSDEVDDDVWQSI